jgi:hypothetical protein
MRTIKLESQHIEVDLSEVLPLRLRDWKVLKARGISVAQLSAPDIDTVTTLAGYVLTHPKAKPTLSVEDVEGLTLTEATEVSGMISSSERGQADRPTSNSSSSSLNASAGDLPNSND